MPRSPRSQQEMPQVSEIADTTPPTEPVEIDLAPEESGSAEIDLAAAPGATVVAPKAEPEVVKPEPDGPLQKALDARQRAEELQRQAQRERDDAVRRASERDVELVKERGEREDAQYNSVLTAIAGEQATLDKAEADYAAAATAGDWATAGKAQRIIGTAAARLDRLEEGKQAFDTKRGETPSPRPEPRRSEPLGFDQQLDALKVPDSAKSWLRNHPEFVTDTSQNNKIAAAHNYLVEIKGVQAFTPAYFEALDEQFGFKAPVAPNPEPEPTPQPQRRSMPVSAPVSREVPTTSGVRQETKMNLSPEERLIARTSFSSDMTDAQKEYLYAQNKKKLRDMRANGQYRATTEENG